MSKVHAAKAEVTIDAARQDVWNALVTPSIIKEYMFGTEVLSDWEQGGQIAWKGEWEGKPYEDKGSILKIETDRLLQYSHYSPLSGAPDTPEHYHTVTYELSDMDNGTSVRLTQDNNENEVSAEHSAKMWQSMLDGLKSVVEKKTRSTGA
jgi:uncharacterized protein YndB with AHSA1/START domain